MDPHSKYRQKYKSKRLHEAYRLYIDGKGSVTLKELVKISKTSLKTLQRYSSRDHWVAEADEARRQQAHEIVQAVTVSAEMAAMATETDIQSKLQAQTGTSEAVALVKRVLGQDRSILDEMAEDMRAAYRTAKAKKVEAGQSLAPGQIAVYAKTYQLIADARRDAYGIPKVTKMEFEDKTPAAKKHAETIREKRLARMAATEAKVAAATATSAPAVKSKREILN